MRNAARLALALASAVTAGGCATIFGIEEQTFDAPDGGMGGGDESQETSDVAPGSMGEPPSCAPGGDGMTNCGSSGIESCCTSLEVEGGTFDRSYTNSGDGGTGEGDPATISRFRLDKYEVTVGRFRQFVNAVSPTDGGTGWVPAAGSGKHAHVHGGSGLANSGSPGTYETGWVSSDDVDVTPRGNLKCDAQYATWTDSPGTQENLPINCVNWWEAYAFCIWDGGFLPSEAEWEYAAAGGNQQLEYPWGATDPGTGNQYAIYDCQYHGGSDAGCRMAPVGTPTAGRGLWGQLDLAGNVSEWALDWFHDFADPCFDCAYLVPQMYVSVESGDFNATQESRLQSFARYDGTPRGYRGDGLGIRCARMP